MSDEARRGERGESESGRTSERNYVLSLVARISFVTLAAPLSYGYALDTTSSGDESAVNL